MFHFFEGHGAPTAAFRTPHKQPKATCPEAAGLSMFASSFKSPTEYELRRRCRDCRRGWPRDWSCGDAVPEVWTLPRLRKSAAITFVHTRVKRVCKRIDSQGNMVHGLFPVELQLAPDLPPSVPTRRRTGKEIM